MKGGYVTVARLRGIPIRLHLTTPLLPLLFTGFRLDVPLMVGVLVLVLAHELGHAAIARANGAKVLEVCLHGLGGHCRHTGTGPLGDAAIAFGGVLGQAWLSVALLLASFVLPKGPVTDVFPLLHETNLRLALFNLVPIPPLDGARAFSLFVHLGWVRWPLRLAPLRLRGDGPQVASPAPRAADAAGAAHRVGQAAAADPADPALHAEALHAAALDEEALARLVEAEVRDALEAARAEARASLAGEARATRDRPGSSRP